MVRSDLFIFGYVKITFEPAAASAVANLLLTHGIAAKVGNGHLIVSLRAYRSIKPRLAAIGAVASERMGLPYYLGKIKCAYGAIAAILLTVFVYAVSSGVVWEVRVEGNERVSREKIVEELREVGFGVGTRFSSVDIGMVESEFLKNSDTVSWIGVNRRGSVAYVSVIEKMNAEDTGIPKGYANIVAEFDGVIEEITVKSGYAAVKVGEAVKKGDLLISGVIPDSAGGGFVYASGSVLARRAEEVSVDVPFSEEKRAYSLPILDRISVEIFDFSINIYKKYGNTDTSCDIIEDVEECVLFNKYRLPVAIKKIYTRTYETKTVSYSSDEVTKIASHRLGELIRRALASSNLVGIKTDGGFTDEGYVMRARLNVLTDIGVVSEFEFTEK